jgi:hypothetical protein
MEAGERLCRRTESLQWCKDNDEGPEHTLGAFVESDWPVWPGD